METKTRDYPLSDLEDLLRCVQFFQQMLVNHEQFMELTEEGFIGFHLLTLKLEIEIEGILDALLEGAGERHKRLVESSNRISQGLKEINEG